MLERDIFILAIQKGTAVERAEYLSRACGADPDLRFRMERLLADHDRQRTCYVDSAATALLASAVRAASAFAEPGSTIGRYKLLEPIGEGGYGVVFMAEQKTPVQRRVALKIIKPGMDTKQVIARFEAERQALALMDHPNIAKVFDAGVTETGRPYFVMELVKGVPITKHCDEYRLTPRQRVELFVHVCHAVQHAHQKGIIHRDIKPTNVLIALYDGKPVPKVIDFGVAKATDQRLTEGTMFTGFGDVIGTPQYMSPEQAELNQLDVDTRSDIYSLGVLLYELLTGTTPLEGKRIRELALLEVLRAVREEEPPRPSTRLTMSAELPAIAAQRGLDPKSLGAVVKGELDWVVMKCLDRDRARRYETAAALAADVRRFLDGDIVQARPTSAAYRLRKVARRHRVAISIAGSVALAILVSAGALGWVVRDRSARDARLRAAVESPLHESAAARARALEHADNPFRWDAELAAAWGSLRRAEELDAQSPAASNGELRRRLASEHEAVEADRRDRDFVARFDELMTGHLPWDARRSGMAAPTVTTALAQAFAATYAVEAEVTPADRAAGVIRSRPGPVREHLLAALDVWMALSPAEASDLRPWLLAVLAAADDDPWRARARAALAAKDWNALEREVLSGAPGRQPAVLLQLYMSRVPSFEAKDRLLEAIRRADPNEFWAPSRFARAAAYDRLAWYSATTDAPELRNETLAVQMAERAVALAPADADFWNTLGVSRYRAGTWHGAVEALDTAVRLSRGGDGLDWIFLAMAHHRLGHPDDARAWYLRAARWARQHPSKDHDIRRFEAEAADLLGVGNDAEE